MLQTGLRIFGEDAGDFVFTPDHGPNGRAVRARAASVDDVGGILVGIARVKPVDAVRVALDVAVEDGGGEFLPHAFHESFGLAHPVRLGLALVNFQQLRVDDAAGFQHAHRVFHRGHMAFADRGAAVQPAPIDLGQAGAHRGAMPVIVRGFLPENVLKDGVFLVHEFNDVVGLAVPLEEGAPFRECADILAVRVRKIRHDIFSFSR